MYSESFDEHEYCAVHFGSLIPNSFEHVYFRTSVSEALSFYLDGAMTASFNMNGGTIITSMVS